MKYFVIFSICSTLFHNFAFAGSSSCTDVTELTSGDTYTASDSDCVINVNLPFNNASFVLTLPETGGTYTVYNGVSLASDHCEDYGDEESGPEIICQPRAITVRTEHPTVVDGHQTHFVFGSDDFTDAGYYLQDSPFRSLNTFTWDGNSNWDVSFGSLF